MVDGIVKFTFNDVEIWKGKIISKKGNKIIVKIIDNPDFFKRITGKDPDNVEITNTQIIP